MSSLPYSSVQEKCANVTRMLTESSRYPVQYNPASKVTIEAHLREIFMNYKNLNVRHCQYTYNDGRTVGMLLIHGLVPISYNRMEYNIPVNLWIPEDYPSRGPIGYVMPTAEIVIARNNPHVLASGFMRVEYIEYWNPESSNLEGTVRHLQAVFSQFPPVYAKKSVPAATMRTYQQASNPVTNPDPYGVAGHQDMGQRHVISKADDENVRRKYRETIIHALATRAVESLTDISSQTQPELGRLVAEQSGLAEKAAFITGALSSLENERIAIEKNVMMMTAIISEVCAWQERLPSPSINPNTELKAEDVLIPVDDLSAQLLKNQADDLAIEDALNVLDLLFQKEVIHVDSYLKQVRKICRRQFYARALMLKISGLQHR